MPQPQKREALAAEFRDAQAGLGLNGVAMAHFLGVHPNTVAKYRNGKSEIPGPVWTCLHLMRRIQNLRDEAIAYSKP